MWFWLFWLWFFTFVLLAFSVTANLIQFVLIVKLVQYRKRQDHIRSRRQSRPIVVVENLETSDDFPRISRH